MKLIKFILAFFLTAVIFACVQKQPNGILTAKNQQIIDTLIKKVGQNRIIENPVLNPTRTSFFNKSNQSKYYVSPLEIGAKNILFTWDDNLTFISFLLTENNDMTTNYDFAADPIFKGTKITWQNNFNALIWFNNKSYKTELDNWHLAEISDCPSTIIFPSISFKKIPESADILTNNNPGLVIVPYDKSINISFATTQISTNNKTKVNGIGFDLNNDAIFDVFTYTEKLDETTSYTRLYININGHWQCKSVHLDEDCI